MSPRTFFVDDVNCLLLEPTYLRIASTWKCLLKFLILEQFREMLNKLATYDATNWYGCTA